MIVLRLAGGLGNQLFQVMAALACAAHTGRNVVPLTSGLGSYAVVRQPDVLRLLSSNRLEPANSGPAWACWAGGHARVGLWLPRWGVSDGEFPMILDRCLGWTFMDGYFQSGWTDALMAKALSLVTFSSTLGGSAEQADCLVHIRGGDFLRLDNFAVVGVDYYVRCVELALAEGCRSFAVITDDPEYAGTLVSSLKRLHRTASWQIMPRAADALTDFAALQGARRRIIGNSTFAWWAAALGQPQAVTWAPDRFVCNVQRDYFLPFERTVRGS